MKKCKWCGNSRKHNTKSCMYKTPFVDMPVSSRLKNCILSMADISYEGRHKFTCYHAKVFFDNSTIKFWRRCRNVGKKSFMELLEAFL